MEFFGSSTLPEGKPKPGWHGRLFHSETIKFAISGSLRGRRSQART